MRFATATVLAACSALAPSACQARLGGASPAQQAQVLTRRSLAYIIPDYSVTPKGACATQSGPLPDACCESINLVSCEPGTCRNVGTLLGLEMDCDNVDHLRFTEDVRRPMPLSHQQFSFMINFFVLSGALSIFMIAAFVYMERSYDAKFKSVSGDIALFAFVTSAGLGWAGFFVSFVHLFLRYRFARRVEHAAAVSNVSAGAAINRLKVKAATGASREASAESTVAVGQSAAGSIAALKAKAAAKTTPEQDGQIVSDSDL